jgi:hypothetical protein
MFTHFIMISGIQDANDAYAALSAIEAAPAVARVARIASYEDGGPDGSAVANVYKVTTTMRRADLLEVLTNAGFTL